MRNLHNIILIIVIMLSLAIGASTLTRGHEWGDDFASYIMQAQSILNSNMDEFIDRNTLTIFESSSQMGPVAYPWGYPLILIPSILLKGIHPLTLKLPGLFFFAGFLTCLYLLIEKRLTWTESLVLVSLFAFNPILIQFLDEILSDIPLMFLVFLCLHLVFKFENDPSAWNKIGIGAILFFAFFVRTTGIILLAALMAHQAIQYYLEKGNRKHILTSSILVVISFGLLLLATSLIFPNGQGSYFEQLKGLTPEIFKENIFNYFFLMGTFLGTGKLWLFVYYLLVVFFLIGLWAQHNRDSLLIIFFFLYFFAMISWPEWQGMRFIFPILPFFIYFSMQGISAIIKMLPERLHPIGRGVSVSMWVVVIATFLFASGTQAHANLQDDRKINGPFDPYSREMFNFIKEETPPDSMIVFFKPRAMRLFTNRDSIMILECENLLLGDYIVLHKNWEYSQILPGDIQNCNLLLKDIYENRRFIVYKTPK